MTYLEDSIVLSPNSQRRKNKKPKKGSQFGKLIPNILELNGIRTINPKINDYCSEQSDIVEFPQLTIEYQHLLLVQ